MKLLRIAVLITADVAKWSGLLCAVLAVGYLVTRLLGFNDSDFKWLSSVSEVLILAIFAWALLGTALSKVLRGVASRMDKTDLLPLDLTATNTRPPGPSRRGS